MQRKLQGQSCNVNAEKAFIFRNILARDFMGATGTSQAKTQSSVVEISL
jgi:hypothetical protein